VRIEDVTESTPESHSNPSALGERALLIGILGQYRAAAILLLSALNDPSFEAALITDPTAIKVDDFQIQARNRIDCYQVKWPEDPHPFTFTDLLTGKKGQPAILKALSDGWRGRKACYSTRKVAVHLLTNCYPSTRSHVAKSERGDAHGKTHFAAFLKDSWLPVSRGEKQIPDTGEPWSLTWSRIRKVCGLSGEELDDFVKDSVLTFAFDSNPPRGWSEKETSAWETAVSTAARQLMEAAAKPAPQTTYERDQLLKLFGRSAAAVPPHLHEFRTAPEAKEPLRRTAQKLEESLAKIKQGYISLTGSPGSGKSTTLTLVLRRIPDRVILYYAYTPDSPNANQGESSQFFSHIVTELSQAGFQPKGLAPHRDDLILLKERFREQLQKIAVDYATTGRRTILLVDGLDHIEREQSLSRSLLYDLPSPSEIPDGLVILLGSQSLSILRPEIQQSLHEPLRNLETTPLETRQVESILKGTPAGHLLNRHRLNNATKIVAGHPLALGYLIRRFDPCTTHQEVDAVLTNHEVFAGDILQSYRAYWNQLGKSGYKVKRLLGLLARLRRPADIAWLDSWADPEAVDQLRSHFAHYFERSTTSWAFFHNSFRLFVLDSSCEDAAGRRIETVSRGYHRALADECEKSPADSLWRAEQFHHLVEAGLTAEALNLTSISWFRSQFFSMRGRIEIFRDLRRAQSLAASQHSGAVLCQLVIAESEIESRFDALDFEHDRLLKLLIHTSRRPEAIRSVREEKKLNVDNDCAIDVCNLLIGIGEYSEAKKIFELIIPHSDLHNPTESYAVGQRRMLVKWGLVALHFLPLSEIVEVYDSCVFNAGNVWDGTKGKLPAPDQTLERERAKALLASRSAEAGKYEMADSLADIVNWSILSKGLRASFVVAALKASLDHSDRINLQRNAQISELLELAPSLSGRARMPATEVLLRLGFIEDARRLFDGIDPSEMSRALTSMAAGLSHPEKTARDWIRIAHALGMKHPARSIFDLALKAGTITSSFVASNTAVAILHAKSWEVAKLGTGALADLFTQVLAPLNTSNRNFDEWGDLHRSMYGILEDFVTACSLNGQSALDLLCDFLDRQWRAPRGRAGWPLDIQRRLLTYLARCEVCSDWISEWLEVCDSEIDPAASSGSRVSEYLDQAEAWLSASNSLRALRSANQAIEFSLGIGYSKDFQIVSWISYLKEFWSNNWRESIPLIVELAKSAVALRHQTHGGAMGEAAEMLVTSCFQFEPELGMRLWDYFDDKEPVNFADTLAEILKQFVASPDDDPELPLLILCDILLPVMETVDPDVVVTILRNLQLVVGPQECQHAVEHLALRIASLAPSNERQNWWRGIRRACKILRLSLPSPSEELISKQKAKDDVTEEAVTLILESDNPASVFRKILREYRSRKKRSPYSSDLNLRPVVQAVATCASPEEISRCRDLLLKEDYLGVAFLESLADRASNASIRKSIWSWGLDLHAAAHGKADGSSPYEREIRPLFTALLAANTQKALPLLFDSVAGHHWLTPASFDRLCVHLIPDSRQRIEFAAEASEYVRLLLQGLTDDAPLLGNEEFASLSQANPSAALMRLILRWIAHPCAVLRHGARRIFGTLNASAKPTWCRELGHYLQEVDDPTVVLGLLIELEPHQLNQLIGSNLAPLARLAQSESLEVRSLARGLYLKIAGEAPNHLIARPTHPTYGMDLPVSYPSRESIGRYMDNFAEKCRKITGLPLANFYRRIDELDREVHGHNSPTRQQLAHQLSSAGLDYQIQSPQRKRVKRIASRILAELCDGSMAALDEAHELLALLSDEDHSLHRSLPCARPKSIPSLEPRNRTNASNEEWLDGQIRKPKASATTDHGWRIAAYRHSFRIHTDSLPQEDHIGMLLPIEAGSAVEQLDFDSAFCDRCQPERIVDYYGWEAEDTDDKSILFVLGGQEMDLPGPPWLALDPSIARALGWIPDREVLFGWKDSSGRRTVESKWWADGPYDCTSISGFGITGAGWVVCLSPEAIAAIEDRFGPLRFSSDADRKHHR
jgi:hypothetical protein